MKTIGILLTLLILSGCSAADRAEFKSLGNDARVKCWSGDTVIYDGKSTGKVYSPDGSDGYRFMDSKTSQLTEVSGNCVITY
jgi:hypothetical protein